MDYLTIAQFLGGAFIYSIVTFVAKTTKKEGAKPSWSKFLRTMVVGLFLGIFASTTHTPLTATTATSVLSGLGLSTIGDQSVKGILRYANNLKQATGGGSGTGNQ